MVRKHYLRTVIEEVDKTHPRLGQPVVAAMVSVKAKKLLLVVSPAGCGKSAISSFVGKQAPKYKLEDRLSIAGLVAIKDELNGFDGVVVVDDIAKTQTPYARINTICTLAELTYSHYCTSHLARTNYEIYNYQGSGIVNIQPVLLKELVKSTEWEASIQDKTLRYYHIYRPLEPNSSQPAVKLKWGISFDEVAEPELTGLLAQNLMRVLETQWGLARLRLHTADLLRATAALDERKTVTQADFRLLIEVLRPLQLEHIVMDKADFEARRFLHSNRLAILVEFATYGEFTLEQLARDYKVSASQAYRILSGYDKDWVQVTRSPAKFAPSPEFKEKLRGVGL